jgi:mono/diheme cytochrome c family protein
MEGFAMTTSSSFITGMVRLRALWLAAALTAVVIAGCETPKDEGTKRVEGGDTTTATTTTTTTTEDPVKRGEYLVLVGGCNDCHTPLKMGPNGQPEPDMSRMLSGHPEQLKMSPAPKLEGTWMAAGAVTMTAWHGPWGTSYTYNLTPDSVTGTGTWTEEMFINTLRSGKHWGTSRPIMPPMPWFNLAKMTDQDLKAIYAYLRTIPPIHNQVPAYEPPAGAPTAEATPAPTDTAAKH